MLQEFLNFDRYLTPSIIRIFYLLQVALILIFGLANVLGSFGMMSYSVLAGLMWLIGSFVGMAVGIIAARIITEIIMVLFQNNEHLAAIRARAEGR
jgi:hypothetical protein